MYDQVSQLVPVQQVDDIDEVHQLDPVHQVDHKDECSKISLQKRHHKMDQPGFKKRLFPTFFKSPGDILRGLILNRLSFWGGSRSILRSFLVDFFSTSGNGPKWSKMDLGAVLDSFFWRPEAGGRSGQIIHRRG